ncbi:hypothetical protein N7470_007044 [Penicillium chermesinum]|nr:hypothetical protein N7470_007044 [Penicillium chermesinum]
MDFLLARPGFQDPDTGEMVYVDSACEIFHKLLGFPEQHETIRGSPNKSGNVPCTHVYGLGYPYRRTWHYDNKNGTKLFFWNEAGPVTYIYSNGKPMFQNPAPSLGRPVFDANVTIPMDEKIGLPKHANQQGIDFTNVESKWSIASAMGGIHEVVADSIAHFYPRIGARSPSTLC